MERYLVAVLAALLIASMGGFFLYVAVVPMLAVLLVLIGLALMFLLGLYIGARTPPLDDAKEQRKSTRSHVPEYAPR